MKKRKALHIGAGMVGRVVAKDLSSDFDITVLDFSADNLIKTEKFVPGVHTVQGSCSNVELLEKYVSAADIVTAAMPGTLGYELVQNVLRMGKPIASVSSMRGADESTLSQLAREKGVSGVAAIGFAPGMSNFLAGRAFHELDECENLSIFVGGIPLNPRPPFNYNVTWSVADLLEEYVHPTDIVRNGKAEKVEALSNVQSFQIGDYPEMESFYTNGLGTLFHNIKDIKNMSECTVRWPGYAEQINLFKALGMFEWEPRTLGGAQVVPREVLADMFVPHWKMLEGDKDLSVFRVTAKGFKGGKECTYTYELTDAMREENGCTSMAWLTACTTAIFARAIVNGLIKENGMHPAELLAKDDELFTYVMSEQEKRNIFYVETVETKD